MSYESSYDTGGGPFRPNKDRGLWLSSSDFLFACVFNAFRMDVIYGIAVVPIIASGGIFVILACLFNVILYAIPIVFIHSFLGQFSSSGFISVFRIAPLFKGLGYIGLILNLTSLAFYSVFAAVPLLFFFSSLQPTLPWSCEGIKEWMHNESAYSVTHCNLNETDLEDEIYLLLQVPSVEFFGKMVQRTFSFPLFGCVLVVWTGVALVLYNSTERIGQILRHCAITLITVLVIIFVRMLFLPGVIEGVEKAYSKAGKHGPSAELWIFIAPMLTFGTFGPGWGSVLSLASYNKFKTNIMKYSWMICLTQLGVLLMIGFTCMFTEYHLTQNSDKVMTNIFELQWLSFLSIPSSLASMEYPHLWSWMFFIVLIIGSSNLVIVQMFSVLTALFDEYEQLRPYRKEVIFGGTGILALISALFCTEEGINLIEVLADMSVATQCLMNLILLIVVSWVYGRERFQRDVEFMTSQVFATWKMYIIRFVTPLFLCITLLVGALLTIFTHEAHYIALSVILTLMPWLALPGYCIFRLMQTNGTIGLRFRRCTKPTDWYPVDSEDRQRYEETVDNPETSHPLTAIVL